MIERILKLIKEEGITAKKLTNDLGISNSSVTDWKKGSKPSCDVIVKLSDYFGVSTDYLLKGTERQESDIISIEDQEWLTLLHSLPTDVKAKCRAELEGYLKYSSLP